MGSLTNRAETLLADHLFNDAYTPVATIYLALSSTAGVETATGSAFDELANTGAYARTAITFGAAASRTATQTGTVAFATATTAWSTAVSWAVCNTADYGVGDVLAYGSLATAKQITANSSGSVASGQVTISWVASGLTDNLANKLLDHMFRNTVYTSPASSTYVALLTTAASDSSTGTDISEPTTGAYARILVRPSGGANPSWDTATGGALDNATAITFATATTAWGTLVGVAIVSDATSGLVLLYDNNTFGTAAVNADDTAQFAAGALDIVVT